MFKRVTPSHNDCVSSQPNQLVVKYSDDAVILSLFTGNSDSHKVAVDGFVDWSNTHRLYINTSKTVELLFDPRSVGDSSPVSIHGNVIRQVTSVKYLGVHIDSDLTWHIHVAAVYARIHQHLHFTQAFKPVWCQ